jgi:hypothetical protein
MIHVSVDFNETNAKGQVKTQLDRINGRVWVGDRVLAVDAYEENMEFPATVAEIEPTGRVLLDIIEQGPSFQLTLGTGRISGTFSRGSHGKEIFAGKGSNRVVGNRVLAPSSS